jgi:hypothetical protein
MQETAPYSFICLSWLSDPKELSIPQIGLIPPVSLLVKAACLIGCLIPAADYDGRMMVIGEDTTQDAIVLLAADSLIRLELHGLHVCLEMWCFALCHPH